MPSSWAGRKRPVGVSAVCQVVGAPTTGQGCIVQGKTSKAGAHRLSPLSATMYAHPHSDHLRVVSSADSRAMAMTSSRGPCPDSGRGHSLSLPPSLKLWNSCSASDSPFRGSWPRATSTSCSLAAAADSTRCSSGRLKLPYATRKLRTCTRHGLAGHECAAGRVRQGAGVGAGVGLGVGYWAPAAGASADSNALGVGGRAWATERWTCSSVSGMTASPKSIFSWRSPS